MNKPATNAAEYEARTRDENKQRELHPSDLGSLSLDYFTTHSASDCRAAWLTASDADKRGLALQIIRHKGHGPDEATIAMYVELLEERFGLSEVEQAICGALERLATTEAQSARTARAAGLKDDATFFQRAANAYAKALRFYLQGLRPEPTQTGYLLPSQRDGEAPHLLTLDGSWICTCAAGESIHWASALIIGIEVGYDDLAGADDPGPSGPIVVTGGDGGVQLVRGDTAIDCSGPTEVAQAIGTLLGRRLAEARAKIAA